MLRINGGELMCGRFYLDVEFEEILKHYFGIVGDFPVTEYEPKEIFPSNAIPVIHRGKEVERTIHLMKWGFAPTYMNKIFINARSETIAEKKMFKEAFFRRRCLVPASGYYEWQKVPGEDNKIIKVKRQISVPSKKIISMAGIYDRFVDKVGKSFWGVSILTKPSNEHVKEVHDRMPIILTKEMETAWIAQYDEDYTPLFDIINKANPEYSIE